MAQGADGMQNPLSCSTALLARVAAVRNPDMAQMKRLLGDKRADRFADAFLKVLSDA